MPAEPALDDQRDPLGKELRLALVDIYDDVISRVASRNRSKMFFYDDLAGIAGEPDDWRCGGRFRDALSSLSARQWLLEDFKMYWRADPLHNGLEFTCCQLTGVFWELGRVVDHGKRYGNYLASQCERACRFNPKFRSHYRLIAKGALAMVAAARALALASGSKRMRLLGVAVPETLSEEDFEE